VKIFKEIKSLSIQEKETHKIEFHNLLEDQLKIHKIKKSSFSNLSNLSLNIVSHSFKLSINSFNKELFAKILKKLEKKTSIRNIRKLIDLYKKVYFNEDVYNLQMMFDQIDNYEVGYIKQKPSFAIAKLKFYTDILYTRKDDLEKAGF